MSALTPIECTSANQVEIRLQQASYSDSQHFDRELAGVTRHGSAVGHTKQHKGEEHVQRGVLNRSLDDSVPHRLQPHGDAQLEDQQAEERSLDAASEQELHPEGACKPRGGVS
jgi:hypothetical protein